MSIGFSGRAHLAAAVSALVAVGVLAAPPPGQSAGAARWGPVEKIAGLDVDVRDFGTTFDPVYDNRARPALVDVRADGSAVTAWVVARPAPRRVLVSVRGARGGWRPVHDLSSRLAGSVKTFDLAVGPAGSASVVWSRRRGGAHWIEESHLSRGTWTAPERIARGTDPVTTVDGSGLTTLAWTDHGVWVAQRAAHARRWTRPVLIAPRSVEQLQLASSPRGDLAAAWLVASTRVVGATRPRGSASWTAPVTLDTMLYSNSVRLVMDASGRALVTWSGLAGEDQDYWYLLDWARSTPQGTWSTRRAVPGAFPGEEGALLDVSMNADGLAVASWYEATGGSDGESVLWAARFEPNGTWSAPARPARGLQSWFDVRPWMDEAGTAHLLASRWTGGIRVFSQRPGEAWRGSTLDHDGLVDAEGVGSRLVVVFLRDHALWSRNLDVR